MDSWTLESCLGENYKLTKMEFHNKKLTCSEFKKEVGMGIFRITHVMRTSKERSVIEKTFSYDGKNLKLERIMEWKDERSDP